MILAVLVGFSATSAPASRRVGDARSALDVARAAGQFPRRSLRRPPTCV